MVLFTQIYEKSVRKVITFFGLMLLLSSCASKPTSFFELQNQSAVHEARQTSSPIIEIEKKSIYLFGIFTTGEYDRFEGNIFDQLRISLYSEARFNYPEYELTNISQEESYHFFKTTYSVKGQLVSKRQIRERLDLMSGALAVVPSSKENDSLANNTTPKEIQIEELEPLEMEPSKDVASTEEVVEMFEKVAKNDSSLGEESVVILEKPQTEEDSLSTHLDQEVIAIATGFDKKVQEVFPPEAPIQEHVKVEEPKLETSKLFGKTIYIVACFQLDGFVEEKVEITEAEVGYPLSYYKTDKWVRVYLDGEFKNVIEAKVVFDDAWPLQYGR